MFGAKLAPGLNAISGYPDMIEEIRDVQAMCPIVGVLNLHASEQVVRQRFFSRGCVRFAVLLVLLEDAVWSTTLLSCHEATSLKLTWKQGSGTMIW